MSTTSGQSELRRRPAYQALEAHREQIGPPARPVRAGPRSRHPPDDRGRGPVSRLLQELGHGRDAEAAQRRSPRSANCASASTRCSPASGSTSQKDRAVLHTALRAPKSAEIVVDGTDVVPEVHAVLERMAAFADAIRSGEWTGHTGRRIRNVVNIGIGGSDLGPGDGLRGAAPLRHARADLPLRLQRRRHGLRRGHARPRPGGDAVHRRVEDVHDARDDDQRAHGARVDARTASTATRRRSRGTSSPCRRTPRRCRSSGSTPRTCSASGTGSAAATRWTRRSACRR